jgi:hypothetical protein
MWIPTLQGVIDRRLLVNYRVDAELLERVLPPPFQPKLVRGQGMVGICLIRLKHVRPRWVPSFLGIGSENAAHRAAVVWQEDGVLKEGVYIRRRDTNSRMNALAGGRLFPGVHHHARFKTHETAERIDINVASDDGQTRIRVRGRVADALPRGSCFGSLEEASAFFKAGSLGYSATADPASFQGLELRCQAWSMTPLDVEAVSSSYYDDAAVFPPGSVVFDCALLMRNIVHEWHSQRDLCCRPVAEPALALT